MDIYEARKWQKHLQKYEHIKNYEKTKPVIWTSFDNNNNLIYCVGIYYPTKGCVVLNDVTLNDIKHLLNYGIQTIVQIKEDTQQLIVIVIIKIY